MKRRLPAALVHELGEMVLDWTEADGTPRLFERDATLWTGGDEGRWLGWLDAPAASRTKLSVWSELAVEARGFAHALVLGMGGSSLAPEVQRAAFGRIAGQPELHVLDSIHPDQVAAVEDRIDPLSTLVVVASKSGSTLEPNPLMARMLAVVEQAVGAAEAPGRFVAITDPGSALERFARERGFRRMVAGDPEIGGRFSALSPFGLVPAAIQGIPADAWLARAESMAAACRSEDANANPGVGLGLLLAAAARLGRDKLTIVAHPAFALFGAWLEQLVAESTGKQGHAILPIDGEPLAAPGLYGDDRLFVAFRLRGELEGEDSVLLEALAAAGQPVVEIDLDDPLELAAELYRWEIATAVAGAVMGVHPFDQPDVESAKIEARRLTAELEATGTLPAERPIFEDGEVSIFGAAGNPTHLEGLPDGETFEGLIGAHLALLRPGDCFTILLFCPMSRTNVHSAARLRRLVRDRRRVATSVGFGPRYLHSTGQAHKGGPDTGVFLMITDEPARDMAVPGQRLTFGQAIAAQARGDFAVLAARGRRVLRLHLQRPAALVLPGLVDRIEALLARG